LPETNCATLPSYIPVNFFVTGTFSVNSPTTFVIHRWVQNSNVFI
jgi:hypothetical protein